MTFRRKQGGATIVEFALVAWIFFMVMFAIIEFGRAFYVRNTTQHLTRCMAREAVVRLPSAHMDARQTCLFESGGNYLWPFFQLSSEDMTGLFNVEYCMKDKTAACVVNPTSTAWDAQGPLCLNSPASCVETVSVCLQDNYLMQEFGILRVFLGGTGSIEEPGACTTMPAESMGVGRG